MLLDTPISTIMTRDVFILGAGDPLWQAATMFNDHSLRHAPVTSQGRLVGMLSLVDLKRVPASALVESTADQGREIVADMMSRDPLTVQASDPVRDLSKLFTENDFHAAPVLEGTRIVGIVSTTDLIRYFWDELEGEE
ncbi:MAG: CBS domain-containing protein [Lewinellaceae bacterium]|nr:CBS domain-containing protein [Saprospiraceae bacterium]MCB9334152.1 CBS domain-containing protein [Lewinellaceae bacterium]